MGGQVIAIFPSKWRAKGRNWWLFFFETGKFLIGRRSLNPKKVVWGHFMNKSTQKGLSWKLLGWSTCMVYIPSIGLFRGVSCRYIHHTLSVWQWSHPLELEFEIIQWGKKNLSCYDLPANGGKRRLLGVPGLKHVIILVGFFDSRWWQLKYFFEIFTPYLPLGKWFPNFDYSICFNLGWWKITS